MRSVKIASAPSTPTCPSKEPSDSTPQSTRSSSPELSPPSSSSSSTQGYWACVYVCSDSQFNLLSSSAKILGKSAFSVPQSEIEGAVLPTRMEQKISQELYNVSLSAPVFIGDSKIILKMIAKNDPVCPPVFYGTRLMEIASVSSPDHWFCCPGPLNPADLLTRTGSTCDQVKSEFWLHSSFLPQPRSSWPTKSCASLPSSDLPSRTINLTTAVPVNLSSNLVISLLEHNQSLSKVIAALTFIHKSCRTRRQNPNPVATWSSAKISISPSSSSVLPPHCHQQAQAPRHPIPGRCLPRLRSQFSIPNWSSPDLQENHLG